MAEEERKLSDHAGTGSVGDPPDQPDGLAFVLADAVLLRDGGFLWLATIPIGL